MGGRKRKILALQESVRKAIRKFRSKMKVIYRLHEKVVSLIESNEIAIDICPETKAYEKLRAEFREADFMHHYPLLNQIENMKYVIDQLEDFNEIKVPGFRCLKCASNEIDGCFCGGLVIMELQIEKILSKVKKSHKQMQGFKDKIKAVSESVL
jgi:hypothetical protein